ncbi:ADP-ribosylglycohydrolase family protein [Algoriphagus sp. PAP.12]|uniref:ADP-ribosylglycohydrolase family protein n=1 Tax=Algoriphagus sp. PAP.12 TaxID=2996678 RepID=UPI00227A507F|nr:ADP-ribosylglycohydrolase family protein [Algoriphagus sp. PAP.12]
MKSNLLIAFLVLLLVSCSSPKPEPLDKLAESGLSQSELQDRIQGMIVGAAIGDAMGAPTEMWSRNDIQATYGFVSSLDTMVREVSPEGIWVADLPAGGTTDDTRWKVLAGEYLLTQSSNELDPQDFAAQIYQQYKAYFDQLSHLDSSDEKGIENAFLRVAWLQEWAKVSQPYLKNDLTGYADTLGRFYGGEMVCAGLLYAPSLGVYFPGNPQKAYEEAFKLSIYDLGYAKDLTALSAAMTAAGMKKGATSDSLLASQALDPSHYFQSRLVGRTANRILNDAIWIAEEAKKLDSLNNYFDPKSPALGFAYEQLDQRLQDMPFHAGEIYLQTITAMVYADFDFMNTLIFLTNYGRDNDTTAALAGGILGAFYGFEALPDKEKKQVLEVNKVILNQDLEKLAAAISEHMAH